MIQGPLLYLQNFICSHCNAELRYDFWLSAWVDNMRRTGIHEKRAAEWSDDTPMTTGHTHEIDMTDFLKREGITNVHRV